MFCQSCGTSMNAGARFCPKCGANAAAVETRPAGGGDTNIGTTIEGKYKLESKLGEGGMGAVYKATRIMIGDSVAIKLLRPETMSDPRAIARFRREAQAAARLKHPNVVVIHDFGVAANDVVFLVMELADGEDLRSLLVRSRTLDVATSADLMDLICSALDEAHQHGVVHRDLKPENILVRQTPRGWGVKVLDFGIAKVRDVTTGSNALTQVGTVMGTPFYMSPEQCMGKEVDSRADIYSLGVILFEMVTGVVPFDSPTPSALVVQHVNDMPPSPRSLNASIPPAVEGVILKALQKNEAHRQQSAGEFARELRSAIAGVSPMATAVVAPAQPAVQTIPVRAVSTEAVAPAPPLAQYASFASPPPPPPMGYGYPTPQETRNTGIPLVAKLLGAFLLLVILAGGAVLAKYALDGRMPFVSGPAVPPPPPPQSSGPNPIPVNPIPVQVDPPPGPIATPTETESPVAKYGTVASSKVTLRERASIRAKAIGLLEPKERVEILETGENTDKHEGVVARATVFGPEDNDDEITLPAGRGVYILDEQDDLYYVETTDGGRTIRGYVKKADVSTEARRWYRVKSASGKTGWVYADFVTPE